MAGELVASARRLADEIDLAGLQIKIQALGSETGPETGGGERAAVGSGHQVGGRDRDPKAS